MRANRAVSFVLLVSASACAEPVSVDSVDFTDTPLIQAPFQAAVSQAEQQGLRLLAVFETPPGLSPDDLVFRSSGGPRLVATAVNPESFLYEMTLDGELIAAYPGLGSFSLTRGTQGGFLDHFFQASGGGGNLDITELDRGYTPVRVCSTDISASPSTVPCDGIAFDHHRGTFLVSDTDANLLLEIDCAGGPVGSLRRWVSLDFPAPAGAVYDKASRSFLGVLHGPAELVRFDADGVLLQRIDLKPFGVQQPVGVAVGQGKVFVADELKGDLNDTTGFIYVFKLNGVEG